MSLVLRAAIYARVSSAVQRDQHTIDGQLLVLREFIARQGWTNAGEYIDDGRSAKTGKLEAREGFARLVNDAERGRFDVLVIVDVDRLTRTDSIEERAAILGPFQNAGIRIVSPSGGDIDLRTMFGQLDVTLRALYAADENRRRSERARTGHLRAEANGRKPGGPTPFGLAYDRETQTMMIDADRAAVVREIFTRVAERESCFVIAQDLADRGAPGTRGPWTRSKVYQIVRSRYVVGEWVVSRARRATIAVPPIITEQLWQRAQQALIAQGKRGLRRTKHVYLLEGLARCALCGAPVLIRSAAPGIRAAYVCRSRKRPAQGETSCGSPTIRTDELDARVWETVSTALLGDSIVDRLKERTAKRELSRRDWAADVIGYRKHLARLARVEQSITARFRRGLLSERALDLELAASTRERVAVEEQIRTAERAIASARVDHDEDVEGLVAQLRVLAATDVPADRRAVVTMLVEPGSAVLEYGVATFDLVIGSTAGSNLQPGVPVSGVGIAINLPHENQGDDRLRIRVVA